MDYTKQNAWDKENCIRVSLKFNTHTDDDIISYCAGKPGGTELKRLIRKGIAAEKKENE